MSFNTRAAVVSRRALIGAAVTIPVIAASAHAAIATPLNASVDTDHPTLEAALAATPAGGVLQIRSAHSRSSVFTVDKAVTIQFLEAGKITTTDPAMAAIGIAASNVRVEDPLLVGTGGAVKSNGDGIRVVATAADPVIGLHIVRPRISEFGYAGIVLEHVHGFSITDVQINRCGYAGVMFLSARNGYVRGGLVKDIIQPAGYTNSYGVAVTRRSNESIDSQAPRSRDITVEDLTVDGVPNWEGLDTHAGENITFRGNAVYNARTGIAIVGSKGQSGDGTQYAPINCTVVNNLVSSGKSDGTAGIGIVFAGAAETLGAPTELASGLISGNTIRDYGTQNTSSGTSIQVYGTVGVSVTDNTIINSAFSGIDFYHDNYGSKASGNTIVDVWTDTLTTCVAIQVRSSHNKISIAGTTIVRLSKTASKVNDRGLNIGGFATNVIRDGGGNDWAAATTLATSGDVTTSEARSYAKRTGFFGVPAVSRPAAIASPSVEPASLKSAVDSLRTALSSLGLTN